MKCPFCHKHISTTARSCPHCGGKIDISFEEASRALAEQKQAEKAREKVRESTSLLGIAVFLFALSLIIYAAIPAPRLPEVAPVYRIDVSEIEDVRAEQVELPQFEIPQ